MHEGVFGINFSSLITIHMVITKGFCWTILFVDAHKLVGSFSSFQKFYGNMKRVAMPLMSISMDIPFAQWGLDVIGPINPR